MFSAAHALALTDSADSRFTPLLQHGSIKTLLSLTSWPFFPALCHSCSSVNTAFREYGYFGEQIFNSRAIFSSDRVALSIDQKHLQGGKVTIIMPGLEVGKFIIIHLVVKWFFQHPRVGTKADWISWVTAQPSDYSAFWLPQQSSTVSLEDFPDRNTSTVEMTIKPAHIRCDHIMQVSKKLVIFTSVGTVDVADFHSSHRYCYWHPLALSRCPRFSFSTQTELLRD